MNKNRIPVIPEWITEVSLLKELQLRNNLINSIPRFISQMPQLKFLYLNKNRIKNFSDGVISDTLHILDLRGNPLEPFFQTFLSQCGEITFYQLKHFIPRLIEKIRTNAPLNRYDEMYPFYGKYRDVLEKEILQYPTGTAQRVKEILSTHGSIENKTDMSVLF